MSDGSEAYVNDSTNENNFNSMTRINPRFDKFNVLLTNARSLSPKILSLQTFFEEHEVDFALITESWLKDGSVLDRDVVDLEHGTNLKIIYKNRPVRSTSNRRVGGGVSIIFDKASCNFRERRVPTKGARFELVAATGKTTKSDRKVAIFCVYLPPKLLVKDLNTLRDILAEQVLQLKTNGNDPVFFIGGDVNRRDLGPAFDAFIDIEQKNFMPTRRGACLDVMFSNASIASSSIWPPLETPEGVKSNHDCLLLNIAEERQRDFVWLKKTTRKHTKEAVDKFGAELALADWDSILPPGLPVDDLVARFEGWTKQKTDLLFPLKTVRIRSNEPEWITDGIRSLAKRKRRVYKREGKSQLWFDLQYRLDDRIASSRQTFISNVKKNPNPAKAYYKAVKSFGAKKAPQPWQPSDLFPGASDAEVGTKITDFFTEITDEFTPLPVSQAVPPSRAPITVADTVGLLRAAKKPDSMVEGDILPRIVKKHYKLLAPAACRIFNAVFEQGTWPTSWKTETTVVIPKVNNPSSLSECRIISCTPFLSKVLETVLLNDLRSEIAADPIQYGGVKKCSVNHLLVDLMDKILKPLEAGDTAVVLGVDYEKAFNRLDHHHCLRQLRGLGASATSLALVRSFLTGRKMRARVGSYLSTCKALNGGSPQGSILGCLLYCLTTQHLGPDLASGAVPEARSNGPPAAAPDLLWQADMATPTSVRDGEVGFGLLRLDSSTEESPVDQAAVESPSAAPGDGGTIEMFKYVDDTTTVESVPKGSSVKHFTTRRTVETIDCVKTDSFMNNLIKETGEIGVKVNCKKTQLLCVSPANGCDTVTSVAVGGGEVIRSSQKMKILGYCLGAEPNVNEQFKFIKSKFRVCFWSMINWKKSGFYGDELFDLYSVFIRPKIETNSVIYHSMLSVTQRAEIEKMQKLVVKLCYGYGGNYEDVCSERSIRLLEHRRELAVEKFVIKSLDNKRFAEKWFIPRDYINTSLRNRNKFHVTHAVTERYKKSPLIYMQNVANRLFSSGRL